MSFSLIFHERFKRYEKGKYENARKRQMKTQILLRFFRSLGGLLVLAIISFVAVRAAYNMYGKFVQAAEASKQSQEHLDDLEAQKFQVAAAVDSFNSRRGLETEIRKRYGVAKPGEGKIEIVREAASTSENGVFQPQNIFVRIFNTLWPF